MDGEEEMGLREREIGEEVEEEREWYHLEELPQRETVYQTQLAQWRRALRKMRVRGVVEGGEGNGFFGHALRRLVRHVHAKSKSWREKGIRKGVGALSVKFFLICCLNDFWALPKAVVRCFAKLLSSLSCVHS